MKTAKHLLIVLLAVLGHATFAQHAPTSLKFKNRKELPFSTVWPATVTDGKFIYAINGYNYPGADYADRVLKYDPKTNEWMSMSHKMLNNIQSGAAYSSFDKNIYVFGGLGPGRSTYLALQRLNTETGIVAFFNTVRNPIAATLQGAAEWDGKIYLYGGTTRNGKTIASLCCYDPHTLKFTTLADMPEELETTGTIINGVLYTVGGYSENNKAQCNKIYAYDIKTNTWTTAATLPRPVSANAVAATGNLIFVIGNYGDESFIGYFNANTNTFTQLKSNMVPRRAAGAAILDNKLYIIGGKNSNYQAPCGGLTSVQAADISAFLAIDAASR